MAISDRQYSAERRSLPFVQAASAPFIVSLRSPQRGYVPEDTFAKLASHLATRFGGPGEPMTEGFVGEMKQTTWRLPRGVAELKHVQGVLVLQYHPPVSSDPAAK